MADESEFDRRDHLYALGWNRGNVEYSSYGTTLVLRARPYTSDFPGLITLRISGKDDDDAIETFLDQDVEVRVITAVFATFGDELPSDDTVYHIRVEPVSPFPGEENDQWVIERKGKDALPFTNAANTAKTFVIKRRGAKLANSDDHGRRTQPMPGKHSTR